MRHYLRDVVPALPFFILAVLGGLRHWAPLALVVSVIAVTLARLYYRGGRLERALGATPDPRRTRQVASLCAAAHVTPPAAVFSATLYAGAAMTRFPQRYLVIGSSFDAVTDLHPQADLAVLSHEIGHLANPRTDLGTLVSHVIIFAGFVDFVLSLPHLSFAFANIALGLLLVSVIAWRYLLAALTRASEFAADAFAASQGYTGPLTRMLSVAVDLADPAPSTSAYERLTLVFAAPFDPHPTLAARLARLVQS